LGEGPGDGSTELIVDILIRVDSRQFGGYQVFRRFAKPRTGRSEAAEHLAAIDEAEITAAEANDMIAALELGNADEFARQRFADEDELAPAT
jgi:hypothetical protein